VEIQYLPGVDNTLADGLSRQDWQTKTEGADTGAERDKDRPPADT